MSTEMIVKSQSPIKSVSNVVQGQPKMPEKTSEHLLGKISNMDADFSQIFDPFDLLQQPEFNFKQAPEAWPEALDAGVYSFSVESFKDGKSIGENYAEAYSEITEVTFANKKTLLTLAGDQTVLLDKTKGLRENS